MLVTFYQVAHGVLLVHLLVCTQNLASTTHSCDSVRSCNSHRAQFPIPISHYPHSAVLQVVLSMVQSSSNHNSLSTHDVTLLNILDWDYIFHQKLLEASAVFPLLPFPVITWFEMTHFPMSVPSVHCIFLWAQPNL